MKRSKNENGSVLVFVVAILAVMMLMATSFIATVNTHRFSSRNMRAYTVLENIKIPVVPSNLDEFEYDKKWRTATHLFYTAVAMGGDEKPDFQAHYKVFEFTDTTGIYTPTHTVHQKYLRMTSMNGSIVIAYTPIPPYLN